MIVHFDDLPIGSDFVFLGFPGVYCKMTADTYRLQGGASPRYWIGQRHMSCRMVERWQEEREVLATQLRGYLEAFLSVPTGEGYCFLRNKIAEYYSVSAARQEEAYVREQEQKREEMGIVTRKEQNEHQRTPLFTDEELRKMTITGAEEGKQS